MEHESLKTLIERVADDMGYLRVLKMSATAKIAFGCMIALTLIEINEFKKSNKEENKYNKFPVLHSKMGVRTKHLLLDIELNSIEYKLVSIAELWSNDLCDAVYFAFNQYKPLNMEDTSNLWGLIETSILNVLSDADIGAIVQLSTK